MNKKQNLFLIDSPKIEEDSFQIHSNIASTLYDIITNHNVSENSFTIGLFGEWGSGKSFIINKLSQRINNESTNITIVNIDVWKYSGQPLLRSILFELDRQFKLLYKNNNEKYDFFKDGYKDLKGKSLQDKLYYNEIFESKSNLTSQEFKSALNKLYKRYKIPLCILICFLFLFIVFQLIPQNIIGENKFFKIIKPVLNGVASFGGFIGIVGIFLSLLQKPLKDIGELIFFRNTVKNFTEKANFSPEQFESIFKDFLSKIENEKYVIVFDNIDRCEPNIAYETLSTIKTFMDVKNCFYIIPADDEAIKNYLANSGSKQKSLFERKFTEEFIDKIFNTYIRIPILKEVERDKYIKRQLEKIDFQKKLSNDDINTITQILYFAYKGESPRNIIRFINDYSAYFQLALKSFPKLLDNIMLFTIMIAIKQKWHYLERVLLDNPDFFDKYPTNKKLIDKLKYDNTDDLIFFLDSIESYYLPYIKNCSFDEYIYFKESEKSFIIADALKSNQTKKITLNLENIKILKREFKKLVHSKGQFTINSFNVLAQLITKNKRDELIDTLIIEFWLGFTKTPQEQIKTILKNLFQNNILADIIDTLNTYKFKLDVYKTKIETTLIDYFKEPLTNNSAYDEYIKIFSILLDSNYNIDEKKIKELFTKWEKGNQYLNSLLKVISTKNKKNYLPEKVLNELINSPIDNTTLEILENWDNSTIPKYIGSQLFEIILNRLKQLNFMNHQQLNQQRVNLEQNYKLILLLDSSFIEPEKKDDFINTLTNITSKVFQYASNQQDFLKLGVRFWIEIAYFSSINKVLIDDKLSQIFNRFIKSNFQILDFLNENIKYPQDILSLPKTKQAILNTSSDIQRKLYKELDIDDSFVDFDLIISFPINQSHIDILLQFLETNEITLDENKLSKYLFDKVITELITNNTDIFEKLKYLKDKFNLKNHKQLIIDNRNGIIDFTKQKPQISLNILSEFKSLLSYTEFFNNILKPIFTFIKAKLEQGEDISSYYQLSSLIESKENKDDDDIKLLFSISKYCLEKNQKIEENYLGINIIVAIYNKLTNLNKESIQKLITENDHFNEWDDEYLKKLTKLEIIQDSPNAHQT